METKTFTIRPPFPEAPGSFSEAWAPKPTQSDPPSRKHPEASRKHGHQNGHNQTPLPGSIWKLLGSMGIKTDTIRPPLPGSTRKLPGSMDTKTYTIRPPSPEAPGSFSEALKPKPTQSDPPSRKHPEASRKHGHQNLHNQTPLPGSTRKLLGSMGTKTYTIRPPLPEAPGSFSEAWAPKPTQSDPPSRKHLEASRKHGHQNLHNQTPLPGSIWKLLGSMERKATPAHRVRKSQVLEALR